MALPRQLEAAATRTQSFLRGMDWFRGLRAGFALTLPLLAGDVTGSADLMGWAALGGFETILSDPGGPYSTRLKGLGLTAIGGAFGIALGTLAGGDWLLGVSVSFVFCLLVSYMAVLGSPFSTSSALIQVIYFCGLGFPAGSPHDALLRAAALFGGGLWAMALSLFLWPVDPYRPARFAVGACYEELGKFLAAIQELNREHVLEAAEWQAVEKRHQNALRQLLEQGWHSASNAMPLGRTQSNRGKAMVVLLESADILLARTVALTQYLEMTSGQDASPCTVRAKSALAELAHIELWIAQLLRRHVEQIEETAQHYRARLNRLPADLAQCMARDDTSGQFLLKQLTDAAENIETALECAVAVRLGRKPEEALLERRGSGSDARRQIALRRRGRLEPLLANLNWRSLMLRHSLRVALVCAFDIALLHWRQIDHGYWLPLTSLIVLQPHVGGTFRRGLQRVGGTVAGGIFAAVLAMYLHSPVVTAVVLFPLALITVGVLPVSYTIFSFFLTPTFVLAFLPYSGDWQLALVRIENTVLGALTAMLAMALFFPQLERNRVARALRRSLAANREYAEELAAGWQSELHPHLLAKARRATGLAHNDTEESLQRVMSESLRGSPEAIEAAMAFVTYLRRFGSGITGLVSISGEQQWKQSRGVQLRLRRVSEDLAALEAALAAGEVVMPPATSDEEIEIASLETEYGLVADGIQQNGERQLARLERQAAVLARELSIMQQNGLGMPAI